MVNFSTLAQTRTGYISKNSSENQVREYFKKNLALLDPVEGLYHVKQISHSWNNYRIFPDQVLMEQDVWIVKEKGTYQIMPLVLTISKTGAYRYVFSLPLDYKGSMTSVTKEFVVDDLSGFSVVLDMPHDADAVGSRVQFKYYFTKKYPTEYDYQVAIEEAKRKEAERIAAEASSDWTGSGFALKGEYIATNFHVVDGAKSIIVHGVNGDASSDFTASVVATDKTNDLAIIRITDSRFTGFGSIPYAIRSQMADVGEDIWVLGYPLTQILGNEIKLTNGVVSSRSGFQGDVATYQISAPVQPGNSGGPLFDSKGNIVGVVNAGVPGAENVGYAIKTSYLRNLADSYSLSDYLPSSNSISTLALKDQVKKVNNFVFFIECSSKEKQVSSKSSSSPKVSPAQSQANSTTLEESLAGRNDGDLLKKIERDITSVGAGKDINIFKIELYQKATLVYFKYKNAKNNPVGWYRIDPETYLKDRDTQTQYKMTEAYNVSISPKTTNIPYGETRVFVIAFPALPSSVKTIDFIEPDGSTWKFFNISLE